MMCGAADPCTVEALLTFLGSSKAEGGMSPFHIQFHLDDPSASEKNITSLDTR